MWVSEWGAGVVRQLGLMSEWWQLCDWCNGGRECVSAVHDGRCSPWVMCSRVSGNQIHDNIIAEDILQTCTRQTTDSWNLLSCSPCSSDYFVVSNEYALGKCIRVKLYILIRKCSRVKVKVGWNIKTHRYFKNKYLSKPTVMKYYYFITIHHCPQVQIHF